MSRWAGVLYRRVANADPQRHWHTPGGGDATAVDAVALRAAVSELLPQVQQRRRRRRQEEQEQGD